LGLTTATRAIAPFAAGGLVVFYFLIRAPRTYTKPTLVYFFTAGLSMYLAWPYMWPAPFSRYLGAINVLSEFPWQGTILYAGEFYKSSTLPRGYLPSLMALQFTEPVVVLSILGVFILLLSWLAKKRSEISLEYIVPAAWFFIPFIGVVLFQPNMYDNFRHFLFITPPLFIFAGLAIDKIFKWVRLPLLIWIVLLAILFPGVYQISQLHPYEYIYYNSLVGGVEGAYREYELDYWATSFREAFVYINQEARPNARVVIWGPELTSRLYAREDLDLIFAEELGVEDDLTNYDYGLLLTRTNRDLVNAIYAPDLFKVVRYNATLVVVRGLRSP
jgi:hypothetical protein